MRSIQKISQFNENVKELLSLDFSKYVKTNRGIGTTIYGDGREPKTEWPSEDSVGNFVSTLRFFMNDGREKISIRCLSLYYQYIDIPRSFKTKYNQIRKSFNCFLDSGTRTRYSKVPNLTNRRLIELFMWGKYVHQNEYRVRELNELRNTIGFLDLHRELRITLWTVLNFLEDFYSLNSQVLNYFDSKSSP
jgi:hypothetical protein